MITQAKRRPNLDEARTESLAEQVQQEIQTNSNQKWLSETNAYMAHLWRYRSLLKGGEWTALFRAYQHGSPQERRTARDLLVYHNMKLVLSIAMRHTGRGLDLLDMLQEGAIGLMTAVDKFDPEKGFQFSTYARHWILQAITRAIANNLEKGLYRIPVHMYERIRFVSAMAAKLMQELGRWPDDYEIWLQIRQDPRPACQEYRLADVTRCRRYIMTTAKSLDQPVTFEESDESYGSLMVGEPPRADVVADARKMLEQFQKALVRIEREIDTLPPRSAMILRLRFGFGEFDPMTLEEIGERYEITRERVRQIEAKTLLMLKERLNVTSDQITQLIEGVDALTRLIASM